MESGVDLDHVQQRYVNAIALYRNVCDDIFVHESEPYAHHRRYDYYKICL